jgi:hypothetical protein
VVDRVRVVRLDVADARGLLRQCLARGPFRTGPVVVIERRGKVADSVTVARGGDPRVFACDRTGVALEGHAWCGTSEGILRHGVLRDPRLDILCVDRRDRHVAAAWVNMPRGTRWVGVKQGAFVELFPAATRLPVRIATARGIEYARSRATFSLAYYAADGRVLTRRRLTAQVAG